MSDDILSGMPRHDFGNVDALIKRRGIPVELRRAIPCPCMRVDSGGARVGCALCSGMGRYYPPELREQLTALVVSRDAKGTTKEFGTVPIGTVSITFPSGTVPADGDQLWPEDDVHVVTQVIPHSYRPVDTRMTRDLLADGARTPPAPVVGDRLLYPDVLRVEYAAWESDGDLRPLREGVDFWLTDAGTYSRVNWKDGRAPPPGAMVSWRYRAPAVYMLQPSVPKGRSQHAQVLPFSAVGYRLDKWAERDLR